MPASTGAVVLPGSEGWHGLCPSVACSADRASDADQRSARLCETRLSALQRRSDSTGCAVVDGVECRLRGGPAYAGSWRAAASFRGGWTGGVIRRPPSHHDPDVGGWRRSAPKPVHAVSGRPLRPCSCLWRLTPCVSVWRGDGGPAPTQRRCSAGLMLRALGHRGGGDPGGHAMLR